MKIYSKTHFPLSPKRDTKSRKAFALVLSLALMGFMVLLIVTLATMVQMQMRLSRQAMIDFKAKQAAKFAAYQAMSRVQTALGPDTRVSANAMMFDNAVSSSITSLENDQKYDWWSSPMDIDRDEVEQIDDYAVSQNRYWVGVWDSRRGYHPNLMKREQDRADYIKNTVEKSLTWLVSGNIVRSTKVGSEQIANYLPTKRLDDGSYVRLVAGGSSSDAYGARRPENDVVAPLVKLGVDPNAVSGDTITDGKETRIAWWVADENQKASLNAVAPQHILDHAQRISYRVQSMPFYSGIHGMTMPGAGGSAGSKAFDVDFTSGSDTSSMSRIRNLSNISQLDILRSGDIPETMQLSKIFFHSASFDTKGLLVNVRDGGMKKDLSLGLTRKDFGNETEELDNDSNNKAPEYFEKPYGVTGYDYKTTAYPLVKSTVYKYHLDPTDAGQPDRKLKGKGHIFGPQMYGNELIADADSMSTIRMVSDMFSDRYLWKDPGGPLWDQLRSYYNLRAEDLADNATLNERVQTDDRYGLKPVVKRFQVFYVPTFVNYGSGRYGLRLHIMPMLILYNPYDTKIKGNTYYAIRVKGQFRHPVGSFRFAIGYEKGGYFQCLRDLRTEMMPSLAQEIVRPEPDQRSLEKFTVPFRLGMNYNSSKSNYASVTEYLDNRPAPTYWTMSRFTKFYNGFKHGSKYVPAYPLGYGTHSTTASVNSPTDAKLKDSIAKSNIDIIERRENSKIDNNARNQYLHWKGIVAQTNIVPSHNVASTNAQKGYSARVAKIPLFLNNIVYAVSHGKRTGSENTRTTNQNYLLFLSQRSIDARNPQNATQVDANDDANLMFMAFDAKGIEPGRAKIFYMKRSVNYVGDPSRNRQNYDDGPNGVIERTKTSSFYEEKNAMMHGLDDGGKPGGCFYVDIPHPEAEHAVKYLETYGGSYWQYTDLGAKGKYVMFDLRAISQNDIYAFDGSRMQPSELDLYIDMSDLHGIYPRNEMTGFEDHKPFGATFNMTPLAYGIGVYNGDYTLTSDVHDSANNTQAGYWNPIHRHDMEYPRLELDIWIWKREGFEFGLFSNKSNIGFDGPYPSKPLMGPSLVHMQGSRFFLFKEPSFPDPSQVPDTNFSATGETANAKVGFNYHTPGRAYMRNGNSSRGDRLLTLAAMRNTRYSRSNESAFRQAGQSKNDNTVDGYINKSLGFIIQSNRANYTANEQNMVTVEGVTGDNVDDDVRTRARFYLNWLTINPRRHSANYWETYDRTQLTNPESGFKESFRPQLDNYQVVDITNENKSYKGLADTLPKAVKPAITPTAVDQNPNSYNILDKINNNIEHVPYGLIFGLPYPSDNEPGHEPFFNARTFVNTNIQATGYYTDGSARSTNMGQKYNTLSRIPKHIQSVNQALGGKQSGGGDGMAQLGHTIYADGSGAYAPIGIKEAGGAPTYQAPIFHILRKTEVVSNPANLTSANLTFGVGRAIGNFYQSQGDESITGTHSAKRSYSIKANEIANTSFAIGNSLCPSRISPERPYQVTWIDGAGPWWDRNDNSNSRAQFGKFDGQREPSYYEDRNVLYDTSWLLNDALWDEYYFSTLPYRKDENKDTVDMEIAYPQNPRIQYYVESDKRVRLTELNSPSTEDHFEQNSSKMWVNGAFNVNSTSIDAWKAVLSTYYGIKLTDYIGKSKIVEDGTPFHRWAAPYSIEDFNDNSSIDMEDTIFQGYRQLSPDEIEKLATAIVEHVKDRGPFYSMSHFVNRVSAVMSAEQRYTENYLGEDLVPLPEKEEDRKNLEKEYKDQITYRIDHTQKGVLQAAIDSTSINKAFHRDNETIITVDNNRNISEVLKGDSALIDAGFDNPKNMWENWRGAIGPQTTGAPTYLMQQDILARLGSFLTVRSDTFKIRAYGEVRNPVSGQVEGKAWCEMVVQRTPEYFDQDTKNQEAWRISGREYEIGYQANINTSKNYNEHIDELSDLNKELGRRFKIVSFRWLNEKEI